MQRRESRSREQRVELVSLANFISLALESRGGDSETVTRQVICSSYLGRISGERGRQTGLARRQGSPSLRAEGVENTPNAEAGRQLSSYACVSLSLERETLALIHYRESLQAPKKSLH